VVAEAAKTLRGIMLFRINETECVVEHDKIIAYRVTDPPSAWAFATRRSSPHGQSGVVMNRCDRSVQRQASIPLFD
jgi:hypothetical protein